jgi:hypothetical protein
MARTISTLVPFAEIIGLAPGGSRMAGVWIILTRELNGLAKNGNCFMRCDFLASYLPTEIIIRPYSGRPL